MYQPTSKQKRLIRRIAVYSLMVLATSVLVTMLVLIMLGYRFNRDSQSIEQGGLVQFISRPTGAKITIGRATLANDTPTKITVSPGTYTTTMTKVGYKPWSKDVEIVSGQVLWLNYAQLVPNTIANNDVLELGKVTSALASPNSKIIATMNGRSENVRLVEIRNDTAEFSDIDLPTDEFSGASKLEIRSWSADSKKLLLRGTVSGKTNWFVVDTDSPEKSLNLSRSFDISIASASFSPRTNNTVVIKSADGDLRTASLSDNSISSIIQKNVASYSFIDDDAILYVYQSGTERKLAYISWGQTEGRDLPIPAREAILARGSTYFSDVYIAAASKKDVSVYRFSSLPSSGDTGEFSGTHVRGFSSTETIRWLSMNSGGRFVTAQTAQNFSTYDAELDKVTTTQFSVEQTRALQWLDNFHVYFPIKNAVRVVEFDGGNGYDLTKSSDMTAVRTSDSKYVYTIVTLANQSVLRQNQMVVTN